MRLKAIIEGTVLLSGINNFVVKCENGREYNLLTQTLHDMGYAWNNGASLLEDIGIDLDVLPIYVHIRTNGRIAYSRDYKLCTCDYKDLQEDYKSGIDDALDKNKGRDANVLWV